MQVLENFGIFNGDEKMSTTTGSKTVNAYVEKGKEDVYYWSRRSTTLMPVSRISVVSAWSANAGGCL